MCGILGQANTTATIDRGAFDRMRDTLRHRGPDGAGTQLLSGDRIALGHRRLSILDLSPSGAQPMTNENGDVWLTFNGEIYNYPALKRELLETGHRFASTSDSEVLIHGYEEWGIDGLLRRIKGMFAFGIYDERKQQLFVARDRFGIKPLVYYHDAHRFLFASEIKAIVAAPNVQPALTEQALEDYFLYSYVPTPRTIYRGVYKLEPAHYLQLDLTTHRLTTTRYWEVPLGNRRLSHGEAVEEINTLLAGAVREHLVSDVPVGVFLSGGYDSSSVLLHGRQAGADLASFSLGFAGSERSEHRAASEIASRLGAHHHERLMEFGESVGPTLRRLADHYDEPYGVSSQLTYYAVSELAARTHKVVLAGDGGDEVLAGYTWYQTIAGTRPKLRSYVSNILGRRSFREWALHLYARKMTGCAIYVKDTMGLAPDFVRRMRQRKWGYFNEHLPDPPRALKSIQHLDARTFLLDNCLYRGDMSSMMHSLEVRVPFLDHELYEFVMSLDPSVYFSPEHPKKLLRPALEKRLPAEILDRPKQGFGFQHRNNLLTPEYADLLDNGELRKLGLLTGRFDYGKVNPEIAFHLVYLELWLRNHSI